MSTHLGHEFFATKYAPRTIFPIFRLRGEVNEKTIVFMIGCINNWMHDIATVEGGNNENDMGR
jgi:hypothetical protein